MQQAGSRAGSSIHTDHDGPRLRTGQTRSGTVPWSTVFRPIALKGRRAPNRTASALASLPGPRRWGFAPELLAAYRKDAGLTKAQLACRAQMRPGMVAWLEQGTCEPSPDQLQRLADALDIDDWALCWA